MKKRSKQRRKSVQQSQRDAVAAAPTPYPGIHLAIDPTKLPGYQKPALFLTDELRASNNPSKWAECFWHANRNALKRLDLETMRLWFEAAMMAAVDTPPHTQSAGAHEAQQVASFGRIYTQIRDALISAGIKGAETVDGDEYQARSMVDMVKELVVERDRAIAQGSHNLDLRDADGQAHAQQAQALNTLTMRERDLTWEMNEIRQAITQSGLGFRGDGHHFDWVAQPALVLVRDLLRECEANAQRAQAAMKERDQFRHHSSEFNSTLQAVMHAARAPAASDPAMFIIALRQQRDHLLREVEQLKSAYVSASVRDADGRAYSEKLATAEIERNALNSTLQGIREAVGAPAFSDPVLFMRDLRQQRDRLERANEGLSQGLLSENKRVLQSMNERDELKKQRDAGLAREREKDRIIQHDVTELHATLREILTKAGIAYDGGIKNCVALLASKKWKLEQEVKRYHTAAGEASRRALGESALPADPPFEPPIVDWEWLPHWANWAAMEENGKWYWYVNEPTIGAGGSDGFDVSGLYGAIPAAFAPRYTGDWRNSRVQRPA